MELRIIGVPFNSAGRTNGVARAPDALRRAGLANRLEALVLVHDAGNVEVGALRPERSPASGLLAEDALVTMVQHTRDAVLAAYQASDFPLVIGGDCPVLLGALAAARIRFGGVGLLMVDGHEDNYPPLRSPTGEAADSELFLALGASGAELPAELREILPLVAPDQLALLGPRDAADIEREGVASLRGSVLLHSDVGLRAEGVPLVAQRAIEYVRAAALAWWLHTDLDVLATEELSAVDYPQPGGLTWDELTEVTSKVLGAPGCCGWTVTIYNPDLDGDGQQARRIVDFVAGAIESLPR
jgi:arginase